MSLPLSQTAPGLLVKIYLHSLWEPIRRGSSPHSLDTPQIPKNRKQNLEWVNISGNEKKIPSWCCYHWFYPRSGPLLLRVEKIGFEGRTGLYRENQSYIVSSKLGRRRKIHVSFQRVSFLTRTPTQTVPNVIAAHPKKKNELVYKSHPLLTGTRTLVKWLILALSRESTRWAYNILC